MSGVCARTAGDQRRRRGCWNNVNFQELDCIGTGVDVSCYVKCNSDDSSSSSNNAEDRSGADAATRQPTFTEQLLDNALLISPFFFWGTAMVAMKGVLPLAGEMSVSSIRLIPAGMLLVAYATYSGRSFPKGFQAWFAITLFALVDGTMFQGFLAEGLRRTSAGLGSVIIDSQPLTVALLASLLFGERLSYINVLGLGVGVPAETIAAALSDAPGTVARLWQGVEFGQQSGLWDSGEWWMLLAAQSMAIGTVMVRWVCQYVDPVMATGWHLLLGGVPLALLAVAKHEPAVSGGLANLTFTDYLSLVYTSLFGSAISYGVFFYNANKGNLTRLSSLTFLTPMFAAVFGYLFLGETLTPLQLCGATVTLGAIALVNKKS
eukprot:jgi/Chlat1/2247/Chrsp17S02787